MSTLRVRLTTSRASLREVQRAGQVVDLPVEEARRVIDAGQGVLVRDEQVERATKTAPEAAVKKPVSRQRAKPAAT